MARTVIKVVVALLVAHALYQFVPVYVNSHLFRDDVKQAALFGGGSTEQDLVEQVMLHAERRDVPLERANVWVRRAGNQTFIDAAYEQPVKVLPWFTYPWQVEVSASSVHITAPRRGGR
jgi:hypothetical protein